MWVDYAGVYTCIYDWTVFPIFPNMCLSWTGNTPSIPCHETYRTPVLDGLLLPAVLFMISAEEFLFSFLKGFSPPCSPHQQNTGARRRQRIGPFFCRT